MKLIRKLEYKFSRLITIIRLIFRSIYNPFARSYFITGHSGFVYSPIGMTNESEQKLFFYISKNNYTGSGKVVDLGCWLGSTTSKLVEGLEKNNINLTKEVYAFDRFIWEDYMQYVGLEETKGLKDGDSFKYLFDEKFQNRKVAVQSSSLELKKSSEFEFPIEILLVDAMKDKELTNIISENFCKKILKNGYIIHQDFAHEYAPWLHVHTFLNRSKLKYIYSAPFSGSSVFKVLDNKFEQIKDANEYTVEYINEVFNYSLSIKTDIYHKDKIRAAHLKYLMEARYYEEAHKQLDVYFSKGYSKYGPLSQMKMQLGV